MSSCLLMRSKKATPALEARAAPQPSQPDISQLVPRRTSGTQGRRPPGYPDLNWQIVGAAIGITPTWVGRIMNGNVRASMEVAQKLAAYLGWTLDEVAALYSAKAKAKVKGKQNGKSRNSRGTGTEIRKPVSDRHCVDAAPVADQTKRRKPRSETGTTAA